MIAQIPSRNASGLQSPQHIGSSPSSGKSNCRVGGAFIDHTLVTQWTCSLSVRLPVCIESGDRDAVIPSPFRTQSVSSIGTTLYQCSDAVLAVNGGKCPSYKGKIPEITTACDHDFHGFSIPQACMKGNPHDRV